MDERCPGEYSLRNRTEAEICNISPCSAARRERADVGVDPFGGGIAVVLIVLNHQLLQDGFRHGGSNTHSQGHDFEARETDEMKQSPTEAAAGRTDEIIRRTEIFRH
jgi:hypothetical protein